MSFRITDMKNFIETAQCDTMALAARKLGITQPSLSESIKKFESDLGAKLFYRSRSGIQLTANGRTVFEQSKVALSSLLNVEQACGNEVLFKGRLITIGCHPVVASYSLPKALSFLSKQIPDYRIHIKHATSREIQKQIQMGKTDLGIVVNPASAPDLVIKKLGYDDVCVWSTEKPDPKVICHHEMVQVQNILRRWKNSPAEIIDTEDLQLATRLTEKGLGYGILPERAVQLVGAKLKKCTHLPEYRDTICLVYRPEFGKNNFEKEVINAIWNVFL